MTIKLPLPTGLTHTETLIVMWLGSDPPLLAKARTLAQGNEFEYGDAELAAWVGDLLYDPIYCTENYPRDLVWVEQEGGSVAAAWSLRASVTEQLFEAISADGWARIRTALLAGWEQ